LNLYSNYTIPYQPKFEIKTIEKLKKESKEIQNDYKIKYIEYLKNCGFSNKDIDNLDENYGYENENRFLNRNIGIIALYSAILQTRIDNDNTFRIDLAWNWLSNFLNFYPNNWGLNILLTFLEISSYELFLNYKNQFKKILLYINDIYLPLYKGNLESPVKCLETFINDFKKNLSFLPPNGKNLDD
jgi:hypothetical protein